MTYHGQLLSATNNIQIKPQLRSKCAAHWHLHAWMRCQSSGPFVPHGSMHAEDLVLHIWLLLTATCPCIIGASEKHNDIVTIVHIYVFVLSFIIIRTEKVLIAR